ncbi:MAG: hypothetical protein RIB03_11825 [Henriciella sp.]|uniref:hypothetical protein n=1 Tax=Henriciella sp. TaxID=1968823 RepID=UPI0032ED4173
MSNRAIAGTTAILLTATISGTAAAQESQTGPVLPIAYQYDLPYPKTDGDPKIVTVRHNAEGLSIAHIHPASEDTPLMSDDPDDFDLSSSAMFLAGPATDGRIVSPEPIAGGVLVKESPVTLEEGQRYADGEVYDPELDGEMASWSIEDLETSFAPRDDDRVIAGLEAEHHQLTVSYNLTRYDRDGEVRDQQTVSSTRDFWFAKSLPYSPLQIIPNVYDSAYFTTSGIEVLDEAIHELVADDMRDLGAVVAQEGEGPAGLAGISAISRVEAAEAFLPETLAEIPVLPVEQADVMLGALFVTEMLKESERIPEGGRLNLSIGPDLSVDTGRAAWREMSNGDFGIALYPEEGTAKGSVLLLMRPVNGTPDAGIYDVTRAMNRSALSEMDEAELEAYANKFQPMGMVRRDGQDFVVIDFKAGNVTIDESSDGKISGSVDATLKLVAIDGSGETALFDVTGDFMAVEGLDARFRSPVARVMRR